eukprot:10571287-Ditylum_brightwellii.AAC.1
MVVGGDCTPVLCLDSCTSSSSISPSSTKDTTGGGGDFNTFLFFKACFANFDPDISNLYLYNIISTISDVHKVEAKAKLYPESNTLYALAIIFLEGEETKESLN